MRAAVMLAASVLALAGCGHMSIEKTAITPPGLEVLRDEYHLSPAVRVGPMVMLSGVIGTQGGVAPKDAEVEFTAAWEQITTTLAAAGTTPDDIVEIVSFHTDMGAIETFARVKDRYIKPPYPTWTAVGVTQLAVAGARAEIKVTALVR